MEAITDRHHAMPAAAAALNASRGSVATGLLINSNDVAELLGISTRNVRAMVSSGELPKPIKLGRLSKWRRDDIERWVRQLR